MKAVEFQAELNSNQTLRIPADVAGTIPRGQIVRVLVLIPDGDSDSAWEQLAALEFGQGYEESDAVYDQLSSR